MLINEETLNKELVEFIFNYIKDHGDVCGVEDMYYAKDEYNPDDLDKMLHFGWIIMDKFGGAYSDKECYFENYYNFISYKGKALVVRIMLGQGSSTDIFEYNREEFDAKIEELLPGFSCVEASDYVIHNLDEIAV